MLKYRFYNNQIGTPQFDIQGELQVLNELGSCSIEYLVEIIKSLEQVLEGKLEQYDFGYEVYSIECRKEASTVIDTFDSLKSIAIIPTQEVCNLMKDWKTYLDVNEK